MFFKSRITWIFLGLLSGVLHACTSSPAENDANTEPERETLIKADSVIIPQTDPGSLSEIFGYHNKLRINKELAFDVLSLGTPMKGSYLILKSDQNKGSYTAVNGEREGYITGSNATDLDADDQIEILIFVRKGKDARGNLIIHEIDSLNNQTQINLPELTTDLSEGYSGQDSFYVANSKIIREFPVYKDRKKTVIKRHIEYVLKNNALLSSGHTDNQ